MSKYILTALVLTLGITAAHAEDINLPPDWTQHREIWNVTGTVRFLNIEGGCWAIDIGNRKLEPVGLPDSFKIDGLSISARVRPENDMTTICAFGQIVTVLEIQKQ